MQLVFNLTYGQLINVYRSVLRQNLRVASTRTVVDVSEIADSEQLSRPCERTFGCASIHLCMESAFPRQLCVGIEGSAPERGINCTGAKPVFPSNSTRRNITSNVPFEFSINKVMRDDASFENGLAM
jgi:hypothetical protein